MPEWFHTFADDRKIVKVFHWKLSYNCLWQT